MNFVRTLLFLQLSVVVFPEERTPTPCPPLQFYYFDTPPAASKKSSPVGGVVRSFRTRKQQPNGPTFVINIKSLYQFSSLPPPTQIVKAIRKKVSYFAPPPLATPTQPIWPVFREKSFNPLLVGLSHVDQPIVFCSGCPSSPRSTDLFEVESFSFFLGRYSMPKCKLELMILPWKK